MTDSISNIQNNIIDEFSILDGDTEMMNFYLIDLGNKLPELENAYKTDEFIIKGCQSKVWMMASLNDEGKVQYSADSNTAITKGLVSMLVRIFSNQLPDDIINAELFFPERIGMNRFVGTQRSNGFGAMVKQMKLYALALKTKTNSNA